MLPTFHGYKFLTIHLGRLSLVALLLAPIASVQAESSEKARYIESVITVLNIHADAIRQLANHNFRYSHNLARHANALHDTFGLVGPMDWHAAEAVTLQKISKDQPSLTAGQFEKMASQCQKSMKTLQRATLQRIEKGGEAAPVIKALDDVQQKCNDCHYLLGGTVPEVWRRSDR
ncbi:MAG: cytochrome c [Magnetococcales bacterium]|nr:cytochrome c [Magnetococcales bacterium]